jgi:hypothetical protein
MEMKFWQLISITRDEKNLVLEVAASNQAWARYEALARNFSTLTKSGSRTELDTLVDTDFIVAVSGASQRKLFLSSDQWLRSWRKDSKDQAISLINSLERFGADIVEDALERGAVKIS